MSPQGDPGALEQHRREAATTAEDGRHTCQATITSTRSLPSTSSPRMRAYMAADTAHEVEPGSQQAEITAAAAGVTVSVTCDNPGHIVGVVDAGGRYKVEWPLGDGGE